MRSHSDELAGAKVNGQPAFPMAPGHSSSSFPGFARSGGSWAPDDGLPVDVMKRFADLLVSDNELAKRIDVPGFALSGDGKTLRVRFLQMCLRGLYLSCCEVWSQLSAIERHDFLQVYGFGPPTRDYFLNMIMEDEMTGGSDCGSSSTGSVM